MLHDMRPRRDTKFLKYKLTYILDHHLLKTCYVSRIFQF